MNSKLLAALVIALSVTVTTSAFAADAKAEKKSEKVVVVSDKATKEEVVKDARAQLGQIKEKKLSRNIGSHGRTAMAKEQILK